MSIRTLLAALLTFGALNAFAGGYYGLSGAEGVPLEWLAGSPFTDYFVPSLILFVVVGGILALAAVMVFTRHHLARAGALAAAGVLLVWIVVQVAIIGYVSWMQPATFAAGLIILLISLLPWSSALKGNGGPAVGSALGLFVVWTVATYLLEARVGTFLRPDVTTRFVYTVVANMLIGTTGSALVIRALLRRAELPRVTTYGIATPLRILVLVPVAALVGGLFLAGQALPTSDPVILANASAQVLVVSIAEVVVCWVLFGSVLRNALGPGFVSAGIAVVSAALAFGVYHFAHSPPFNTPAMVFLLSVVGVATGIFFFLAGDLYSTLILHNAFAIRGVVQALADSGNLDRYASPQMPLIATAIAALVILVIADVVVIRPHVRATARPA